MPDALPLTQLFFCAPAGLPLKQIPVKVHIASAENYPRCTLPRLGMVCPIPLAAHRTFHTDHVINAHQAAT